MGCGGRKLPPWLTSFSEVRLDVDETVKPDIVASMTDLGDIGTFDVIYCSHALEHLHPEDILKALAEFKRCLTPDGFAIVIVPDCEGVAPTFDVLGVSETGLKITGYDLYYGHIELSRGKPYWRHQMAFIAETLRGAIQGAGFSRSEVRRTSGYNLLGVMAP